MFKTGDKCVVLPIPGGSINWMTVVLRERSTFPTNGCSGCGNPRRWVVENHPPESVSGICECILRKLDNPPPPSEELGSWDLCPWQPKETTCAK